MDGRFTKLLGDRAKQIQQIPGSNRHQDGDKLSDSTKCYIIRGVTGTNGFVEVTSV